MLTIENCKATECKGCGGPALIYTLVGRQFTECDPCANAEKARREAETRRKRAVTHWEAKTPPDMARALNWGLIATELKPVENADERSGIAMIGRTETGKTRLGYWLLKKLAVMHGISGKCVSHAEYRKAASAVNASNAKRSDDANAVLSACRHVPALVIDDIGKGASTDVADEAFFDLLTYRRDHNLLTHWTANAGSQWLSRRFGEDKGPAIISRLGRLTKGQVFIVPQLEE